MSFSINRIGTPDAIKRSLDKLSGELTGLNKQEFDAIKPALETILDQQVANGVIHLDAGGHSSFSANGAKTFGTCSVTIKAPGALLAE
jgi:hypothetical protein